MPVAKLPDARKQTVSAQVPRPTPQGDRLWARSPDLPLWGKSGPTGSAEGRPEDRLRPGRGLRRALSWGGDGFQRTQVRALQPPSPASPVLPPTGGDPNGAIRDRRGQRPDLSKVAQGRTWPSGGSRNRTSPHQAQEQTWPTMVQRGRRAFAGRGHPCREPLAVLARSTFRAAGRAWKARPDNGDVAARRRADLSNDRSGWRRTLTIRPLDVRSWRI